MKTHFKYLTVALAVVIMLSLYGYSSAFSFDAHDSYFDEEEFLQFGSSVHECHLHSSEFHYFAVFISQEVVSLEDFHAWARPLRESRNSPYDECLVNIYTFINHFGITRDEFQQLIDETQIDFRINFNLDVLFSGDMDLIEQYYCVSTQYFHWEATARRMNAHFSERIRELQQIVNANAPMSLHFHDIWTITNVRSGVAMRNVYNWMRELVDAGQYEMVNIVELVNRATVGPSRAAFERFMREYNLHLFTHYNLDIIFSNDWDLILSYYAAENQHLHDAQVQAAFDRHVAAYGMPDISWQLNTAQTAPTLRVRIDGQFVHIPANEQQPLIENGRTLVPFRIVMEALGFTVSWDGQTRTASLAKTGYEISVQLGSTFMLVNGNPVSLDVPAQSMNGRTMVPLRALSEATGMQVRWDGGNFIVEITTR